MWFHESFQANFSKFTWFPFLVIACTSCHIQICQTVGISSSKYKQFHGFYFGGVLLFGPTLGCPWISSPFYSIQKSGDTDGGQEISDNWWWPSYRIEWLFLKSFGLLFTCTMNQTVASLRQVISQVQNVVHQVASNWDLKVRNGSVIGDQTTLFSVKI